MKNITTQTLEAKGFTRHAFAGIASWGKATMNGPEGPAAINITEMKDGSLHPVALVIHSSGRSRVRMTLEEALAL